MPTTENALLLAWIPRASSSVSEGRELVLLMFVFKVTYPGIEAR